MGFAFIREGDASSHGGRVLACDPTNTDDGKPIALIGDMVSCPRCGGIFPIVRVKTELRMSFNGRAVVSEGDMTALRCNAHCVAKQRDSLACHFPRIGLDRRRGPCPAPILRFDFERGRPSPWSLPGRRR
ncbi:putative Zn-binding protein involved in type VI secretion [Burkholderia sp. SJZ115]|nr:putative Zn-binding protein involved in type VI secretion [Burkholderia sp. SJZ089]TWC99299.1 putative Zn-binding protein involved in type VI secretion [Burkholderia sp. SJZ115]TWD02738.1 putative Zn-binding protein involved in type VI secretion [Burkholderia sp. SJZ091]